MNYPVLALLMAGSYALNRIQSFLKHSHTGDNEIITATLGILKRSGGFGAGANFLGLFPVTLLKSLLKMEQLLP